MSKIRPKNGSAFRLILVTPEGDPLHCALWLLFKTSNNEAAYEAHIVELNLAKVLGPKKIDCFIDSQLITKQVLGEF